MDGNRSSHCGWIFGLIVTVVLFGCGASTGPVKAGAAVLRADSVIGSLTEDIEALYLAWHDLDQVHGDIKFMEREFLFDADDRQLGYLQKIALYVQDATVRIHHRWDQLAVLHYIRPEMLRDYLTLNVKGLTSTLVEIGYDLKFMDIYEPFIDHAEVRSEIDRARTRIQAGLVVMDRILGKLRPWAKASAPPTRL